MTSTWIGQKSKHVLKNWSFC